MNFVLALIFFLIGLIIGALGGFFGHKIVLRNRIVDGTCTQFLDGEMYLHLSEVAQRKLADPKTEVLKINVTHPDWKEMPSPRNSQPL